MHTTSLFRALAKFEAKGDEMPGLGIVEMPHPLAGESVETLKQQAENAVDRIIAVLTRPAGTEAEAKAVRPEVIKVTGNDYASAYENFNRVFLEKRWGDGLPLVPPTRERVDWMLSGTDLPPDEIVVQVRPSARAATVEAIAVNAVMAGAIPAYMPVIIAALKAFNEVPWGWGSVTTTACAAPIFVVNGPIAKQLDINSKSNATGYGWRANATIGRTIEMIFHCIGGAVPGFTDMSTLGSSHTFTSIVFAENEDVLDAFGWPTYAEERGFDRKTSAVSATVSALGYRAIFTWEVKTAEEFMDKLVWSAAPFNGVDPSYPQRPVMSVFFLIPENVRTLAASGWTKSDLRNQFAARASRKWTLPLKEALKVIDNSVSWYRSENAPAELRALPDDFPLSLVSSDPDDTHVFVVGGAGKELQFYPLMSRDFAAVITKEIELPGNWDEILQKASIAPMPMPKLPW